MMSGKSPITCHCEWNGVKRSNPKGLRLLHFVRNDGCLNGHDMRIYCFDKTFLMFSSNFFAFWPFKAINSCSMPIINKKTAIAVTAAIIAVTSFSFIFNFYAAMSTVKIIFTITKVNFIILQRCQLANEIKI